MSVTSAHGCYGTSSSYVALEGKIQSSFLHALLQLVRTADTVKTRLCWCSLAISKSSVILNIFETEQLQIETGSRQD